MTLSGGGTSAPSAGLEARRKALKDVMAEEWEYALKAEPEYATVVGDSRYASKLNDRSEKAYEERTLEWESLLSRLQAIDTTSFPEEERLDHVLLSRMMGLFVEDAKFTPWLMPINQFSSPHLELAQLVGELTFSSTADYEAYLARLHAIPGVLDDVVACARKGATKGLIPPKFILAKVVPQADALATPAPEASVFAAPLASFPASVPDADRIRLRAAILDAIAKEVAPAYRRFSSFVRDEYAPKGRDTAGYWALPDGDARYAFEVKDETTTNLSPAEIHETGLKEVARIEGEMRAVAAKLGFPDLQAMAQGIKTNPTLHFRSRGEMVALYQKYVDQMYPKLPLLFGHLPVAKLKVLPMEQYREKSAAGADYWVGTADGSRSGRMMINTGDFMTAPSTNVETTAYHEGVPGHHLQLSIALERSELPPFRQHADLTAYVEGWALYAERLGEEVGFFQEPYSYYGHLQDEMLRAIRLVVDTGLHSKRWTREQAVAYFHAHSTSPDAEIEAEVDRYLAIPGQALAYKIGQLRILALREKAKSALGDAFDLRGFHDLVLDDGALPLGVLEEQVDRWIRARKGQAPPR